MTSSPGQRRTTAPCPGWASPEVPGRRPAAARHGRIVVMALVVATLAPVTTGGVAWAARPLDTEDTGTTREGGVELELGAEYVHADRVHAGAATAVLSVGILEDLDIRAESAALFLDVAGEDARDGLGDTRVGVKYRLVDEAGARPAVALVTAVRLPTADPGLGDEDVDVQLLLAVGRTVGAATLR
jgi:Putative MetA-pathway of phenol degradation